MSDGYSNHFSLNLFFFKIKQECWWLYVADQKHFSLISAPVYLCTLKDKEEVEVKFSAPKIAGDYTYWVVLTSDSYFDVDVKKELRVSLIKNFI